MEDHCIETGFTPVYEDRGNGDVLTHYKNDQELPDWLGEDAELQLSLHSKQTGGGRTGIRLVGHGARFDNDTRQPVFRINGVWTVCRTGVDSKGNRRFWMSLTDAEWIRVMNFDGDGMPDQGPRPLTKRLALIAGRKSSFKRERYVVWAQDAQAWNMTQDQLAHAIPQLHLARHFRESYQETVDSEHLGQSTRDWAAREVARKDQEIASLQDIVAKATVKYAELNSRLMQWEGDRDPDAGNPLIFERIELVKKRHARVEEINNYELMLKQIGEGHEQYSYGLRLVNDLKEDLGKIDARIAEIDAA